MHICMFNFICIFSEQLSGQNLGHLTEVTQSVNVQKQNLDQLITITNEILETKDTDKWTVGCEYSLQSLFYFVYSYY